MKRQIQKLLGIAALAFAAVGGSFIATPAHAATVTCTPYGTNYGVYPTDTAGHAQLCSNSVTGDPGRARADQLFKAVSGAYAVNKTLPAAVTSRLIAHDVHYFFFNNRADANAYFSSTFPYNTMMSPPHVFVNPNARCGNTGYGYNMMSQVIAVAVYDTCQYDHLTPAKSVPNPSLENTVLHETGHAFDFSFGTLLSQLDIPSNRTGFNNLATNDINALTPSNWSTRTAAQKDAIVCNLFAPNNNKPSELEQDLGVVLTHGNSLGQVCAVGSPNGTRYSYWVTPDHTPTAIVQDRLPYFTTVTGNRQELFAELFYTEIYGSYGTSFFLTFTNSVLVDTSLTPRAFNCTRKDVNTYANTGAAPATITGCVPGGPL